MRKSVQKVVVPSSGSITQTKIIAFVYTLSSAGCCVRISSLICDVFPFSHTVDFTASHFYLLIDFRLPTLSMSGVSSRQRSCARRQYLTWLHRRIYMSADCMNRYLLLQYLHSNVHVVMQEVEQCRSNCRKQHIIPNFC